MNANRARKNLHPSILRTCTNTRPYDMTPAQTVLQNEPSEWQVGHSRIR